MEEIGWKKAIANSISTAMAICLLESWKPPGMEFFLQLVCGCSSSVLPSQWTRVFVLSNLNLPSVLPVTISPCFTTFCYWVESQNSLDWEGHLKDVQSSHLVWPAPTRANHKAIPGCPGPQPVEFWVSSRMEVSACLSQSTGTGFFSSLWGRGFFLTSSWYFPCCNFYPLLFVHLLCASKKAMALSSPQYHCR